MAAKSYRTPAHTIPTPSGGQATICRLEDCYRLAGGELHVDEDGGATFDATWNVDVAGDGGIPNTALASIVENLALVVIALRRGDKTEAERFCSEIACWAELLQSDVHHLFALREEGDRW